MSRKEPRHPRIQKRRYASEREGKGRFTVMVIPHSEKRIINLRVTALVFVVLGIMVFGVASLFFYIATVYSDRGREVAEQSTRLEQNYEGLQQVREQITGLRGGAGEFQAAIQRAMQYTGSEASGGTEGPEVEGSGDFLEFEWLREASDADIPDSLFISAVSEMLDSYTEPLIQLSQLFQEEREFLMNLPVLWPVDSRAGQVRRQWGPGEDPIRGEFDMSQGVLIWDVPGSPVVASANGKITRVDFDPNGYGWHVDIEHSFGFKTRYAHLQSIRVQPGDQVTQGQVLGTLGSSGNTVEPRLGFEVWLGTENIDPNVFLTVRPAAGTEIVPNGRRSLID